MKSPLLHLLFTLFIFNFVHGQIKIGDNPQNIDPSSVLELESTTRALVITRVDSLQMNAIVPSRGALIYNTDTACVHYYDGTDWVNLCSTLGLSFTANSVVNDPDADPTIVITRTGDNFNFEVAPNSIRSSQIVDGGVNGVDIQNNSIGNNKLADDSVGSNEIQDFSITDSEMDYTQVTLSDFTNDAGFITGVNIVSPEPNNSIFDNGGAFYDDSPLQNAIATNAANIAADGDTDSGNEIQNLTLTGDQLGISGSNTVTLPSPDGSETQINPGANVSITGNGTLGNPYTINAADEVDGSITNEIQNLTSPDGTVNITPAGPNGTDYELTVTPAAAADGSETIIDATLSTVVVTGIGTLGDPYVLTDPAEIQTLTDVMALGTSAGNLQINDLQDPTLPQDAATKAYVDAQFAGGIDLFDPATISGSGISGDEYTLADDGVTTVKILDENVTPEKIEAGGTGQILTTDAAGDVVWATAPVGGTTELADQITIVGDGQPGTEFEVADEGITPQKIEAGANGQVLTTDAAGDVVWAPVGATGSTELADQVTIVGDGQVGNEFEVADDGISTVKIQDDAITTVKIADDNVTPEKIAPGANGEVLTTDAAGDVVWAAGATGGSTELADQVTIVGDGQVGNEFRVADGGISTLQLADDNVTPAKLEAGTNGQILTTDAAGDVIWSAPPTGGTTEFADQVTIVGDGQVGTEFQVADNGITSLQLADNAVTTTNIVDDNVTPEKLAPGTNGQFLTTDAAGDVIWINAPPGGSTEFADQVTIDGDGQPGTEFGVVDGGIGTTQLADDAVTTAKIIDGAVTTLKLTDGSVTTIKIEDDAVTNLKLADDAVSTTKLVDASVTTIKIDDGAVTNAKLANDAVATVNILDDNVTVEKIDAGADGQFLRTDAAGDVIWTDVTLGTTELADQVTIVGDGQPGTEFEVNDGGIITPKLADDAVTTIKILDDNVTPEKLSAGANGQLLTTNATGDVVWAAPPTGGTTEFADQITIIGDGSPGDEFRVNDGGITPVKLALGGADQILRTDPTGTFVSWVDLPNTGIQNLEQVLTVGSDANGLAINNIADPVAAQDAATMGYVDTEVTAEQTRALAAEATIQADVDQNELDADAAIALKEDSANKSTDVNLADATNTLFPTELAVRTYVDTQIAGVAQDDDITAASLDTPTSVLTISEGATDITADLSALEESADITAEETRALAAEAVLQTNIDAKEDSVNKSSDVNLADATNTLFPTELAVRTYVDTQIAGVAQDDDITAASLDTPTSVLTISEGATDITADLSALEESADITAEETRALAAEAAIQADVDQNELDADNAIAALQGDVDQNELDADAAIALKEDSANKSTDVNLADATNTLFPTELAVKTYVDNQIGGVNQDDDITSASLDTPTSVLTISEGTTDITADLSALEESAAITAEETRALAAEAAIQADVDQNELDADNAIATLQGDVDQNELDADNAIAALQADVDTNEADADAGIAANAAAIVNLNTIKENTANKSTNINLGPSNTLFPTQLAVRTYVENQLLAYTTDDDITSAGLDASNQLIINEGTTQLIVPLASLEESADIALKEDSANKSTDGTLSGNSNTDFPTEQAVKTYVDTEISNVPVINLENTNLVQTGGENRSYNLNGGQLHFLGSGNIGIGTTNPQVKFHVSGGQVRAATFSSGDGLQNEPAYRFSDDADTGMWSPAADELAFSIGDKVALQLDEPTNTTTNVIVNGAFTTSIRSSGNAIVNIAEDDYTVVVSGATQVNLLPASGRQGRIYIIKKTTPLATVISSYVNSNGTTSTTLFQGVTQLQSDGGSWQQIN